MNIGDPQLQITLSSMMMSSHQDLVRLAKWEGLRYNLDTMSKRQLARLIRWKITRNKKQAFG